MINKICKCGNVVTIKAFHCSQCMSKISTEWRKNNKVKIDQYVKDNVERIKKRQKKYRKENRDRIIQKWIKINKTTLTSANQHYQLWTIKDYEVAVLKNDDNQWVHTVREAALLLGRTYNSIQSIRRN